MNRITSPALHTQQWGKGVERLTLYHGPRASSPVEVVERCTHGVPLADGMPAADCPDCAEHRGCVMQAESAGH